VDFQGRRFEKGRCYHYHDAASGTAVVGIRSFYSETEANCVLILHASRTFLGEKAEAEGAEDENYFRTDKILQKAFLDVIAETCPSPYVQCRMKLKPRSLSNFGQSCLDPITIPELIYEPLTKGAFGYVYDDRDASNRVGLRDEKRLVELFCGAGGMHHGYKDNGFKTVAAVDKFDAAIQTFRHNNPESKEAARNMDVNEFLWEWTATHKGGDDPTSFQRSAEVLHASSPCQGFSGANRTGGANDGINNELAMAFPNGMRATNALAGSFENVKGVWSKKGMPYLKRMLIELLRMKCQFRVMLLRGECCGDDALCWLLNCTPCF
jgi:hypothetical protein